MADGRGHLIDFAQPRYGGGDLEGAGVSVMRLLLRVNLRCESTCDDSIICGRFYFYPYF